jgi:hypothetical protein
MTRLNLGKNVSTAFTMGRTKEYFTRNQND